MIAIVGALILWAAIGSFLILMLRLTWPAYEAAHPLRAFTVPMQIVRLAMGAVATLGAGALVWRVAETSGRAVLIFGTLLLVGNLFVHLQEPTWSQYPLWYHVVFLGYLVPLTLLGGRLAVSKSAWSLRGFTEEQVPTESSLDQRAVDSAWFRDSYQAPLHRSEMSVADLFEAVFGHHPRWARSLLILRNRIAGRAGLDVAADATIRSFDRKPDYAVGDLIGPWPIFHLSETELIAGRDNSHLDFRLSILKLDTPHTKVAISTICNVHNGFGKLYLFFIVPFHRLGMRHLMRRAIAAGRL